MSPFTAIRLVAAREISTRLKSNTYRYSTVAIMLFAIGSVIFQQNSGSWFDAEAADIALLPATQDLSESLQRAAALFDLEVDIEVHPDRGAASAALDSGDVDVVVLSRNEVMYREQPDSTLSALVSRAVYDITLPERAAALGLTVEQVRSLTEVEVPQEAILRPDVQEDRDAAAAITYVGSVILFIAISFYGQWVLVGVVEEKSNRVVEVLLGVLAPWQMLAGKVGGIILLAAGQILAAGIAFVGALFVLGDVEVPRLTVDALVVEVVWLVVGVVLYNFVYAAVGATVTRAEEASSATTPIMVPLLAGYLAGLVFVPTQPHSLAARALSLFPLTSPLTMPARFAAGGVSPLEMAVALGLAVLGTVAVVWFAGRVYAGAILQGRRMSLLAAFRRRDVG